MIHRSHHKAFAGQSRELRDLVVAMRRGPGAALHEYHGGVAAVIVIAGGLRGDDIHYQIIGPGLVRHVAGQRGQPGKRGIRWNMDGTVRTSNVFGGFG